MFEDYQICPYTGLRSFTEEESIYFKGRDNHIQQATALLEKNKFLMLTGASGDGKSSLVFAGIIPNAKSGFLKSTYSNWSVVSFRPERTPLKNLSESLARQLGIPNAETVESELTHGFSALVDLYKSSKRYLDENSNEWLQADETKKAAIKREATNLIILTDQFEEFFTNPENYHTGIPSTESSLTVNLLLETARLALEESLPIYIVFTMRSDYIGQCAAFRGLPEYIGFSQFFVPRLNRAQLQQVIEEPAKLSGNKISRRLSERLILDITEDVDQLPILQHALSQIWSKASNGTEEMDLLHYAMVGGMADKELPDEDVKKFEDWFGQRAKKIQACYKKPGLHNIIDTHASKLFVITPDYYFEKTGEVIDESISAEIIKATFTCLTKIDQERAVRNRMTLQEIKDVIGRSDIDTKTIGIVLDQFREPGNTFFRPFLSETEEERQPLRDDDVLDITHESLIRNWAVLGNWAQEEFNHHTTFQDFYQQVERWVKHDKSRGFLLPIGPLTYFDNWFKKLSPNAYWVSRYLKNNDEKESTLDQAKDIISNSKEYLKRSAAKHAVTRVVMKYGPQKIASVMALMVILLFSSFYVKDMMSRQNEAVMKKIETDALELFKNKNTSMLNKQIYVLFRERLEPGMFETILGQLDNDHERAKAATGVAIEITVNDRFSTIPLKKRAILYADSVLNLVLSKPIEDKKQLLITLIDFVDITEYVNYHLDDSELNTVLSSRAKDLSELVVDILMKGKGINWNAKEINEGIELSLNHKAFTKEDIRVLTKALSPFEGNQSDFISNLYPKSKLLFTGSNQDQLAYNGLYQELAYLYAAQGNAKLAIQCVDTLHSYHSNYDDYATDGYTVAGYFIKYNYWEALEEYVATYSKMRDHPHYKFYEKIIDRSANMSFYLWWRFNSIFFINANKWHNPILEFQDLTTVLNLFEIHESIIKNGSLDRDNLNYALANLYKKKGITLAKWEDDKNIIEKSKEIENSFRTSLNYYNQISDSFLDEEVKLTYSQYSRRELFKYPDYAELQSVYEPRNSLLGNSKSSAFFHWICTSGKFNSFYNTVGELEQIMIWLNSHDINLALSTSSSVPIELTTLELCDSLISQHPKNSSLNKNILYLMLLNTYFDVSKKSEAIDNIDKIDMSSLSSLSTDPNPFVRSIAFQNVCNAFSNLVVNDKIEWASEMLVDIKNEKNRAGIYGYASVNLSLAGNKKLARVYLDSALNIINGLRAIPNTFFDFRKNIAYAIALQGDENSKPDALQLVKNMEDFTRHLSNGLITRGIIANGEYYPAYSDFPQFVSPDTKLYYINHILHEKVRAQQQDEWTLYHHNYNWLYKMVGHSLN